MATSFLHGIEFFKQLKKKITKDYSCVARRHSNQRFRRCDLKQMLTDDDGHPLITTVHFLASKKGRLRSSFFTIKPKTLVDFRVILNSLR